MSSGALNSNQFYTEQKMLSQSGGDEHQGFRPATSNLYVPNFARGASSEISANPSQASAFQEDD